MPSYRLRVNGRTEVVAAPADTPLLWILRDQLGLTGTKMGCGIGQCGSCTVQLAGTPVRSCLIPISNTAGASISTIEHLHALPGGAQLQDAWVEEDVPQCGYCQSGMLMEAHALLHSSPRPDDEQIDDAMSAHICRCGTYVRIRKAIKRAGGSRA